MRVLIPALSSATRPDGVSRHAVNLTRCLLDREEIGRVDLILGRWQLACFRSLLGSTTSKLHLHVLDITQSSLARNTWYYARLPGFARRLQSSVVHLTYPAPIHRARLHCPVVVTLHDLYPYDIPQNFGYPRVLLNRAILDHCLGAVDAITCVSASTFARLEAHSSNLALKASCIYNCVERSAHATSLTQLRNQPFILVIAQHRRNKNIPLTLRVFERLLAQHPGLLLCLVGRQGPETTALHQQLKAASIESNVLLLDGISDPQLQWCYRHCELLLATSTAEGFGLPIAEAMLAGCPIVCSDISSFRELGEGFCHFVPPNEEAFTRAAEAIFGAPRPAAANLPQLSAANIGLQSIDLYHRLLSPHVQSVSTPLYRVTQKGASA